MLEVRTNFKIIFIQRPGDQLGCSKELWVFWYGDEPNLKTLINSQLIGRSKLV